MTIWASDKCGYNRFKTYPKNHISDIVINKYIPGRTNHSMVKIPKVDEMGPRTTTTSINQKMLNLYRENL